MTTLSERARQALTPSDRTKVIPLPGRAAPAPKFSVAVHLAQGPHSGTKLHLSRTHEEADRWIVAQQRGTLAGATLEVRPLAA